MYSYSYSKGVGKMESLNEQLRVIIAEDDRYAKMILEELVTGFGYEVCANVSSGTRLITEIIEKNPDIVLLDIGLKQLDGLTAIKEIMSQPHNPLLQIIIITGSVDFNHLQAGYELESIDYIPKPYQIERIEKALSKAKEGIRMKKIAEAFHTNPVRAARLIEIVSSGKKLLIDREQIVYAVKVFRKHIIYLYDGSQIETYFPLAKIKQLCNSNSMFISKRAFLININYVVKVMEQQELNQIGYVVSLKLQDKIVKVPLTKKFHAEFISLYNSVNHVVSNG